MAFFNEFPHTRTYDSDLAWLIRRMKEVLAKMDRVDEILEIIENLLSSLPETIRNEVAKQILEMAESGAFGDILRTLFANIYPNLNISGSFHLQNCVVETRSGNQFTIADSWRYVQFVCGNMLYLHIGAYEGYKMSEGVNLADLNNALASNTISRTEFKTPIGNKSYGAIFEISPVDNQTHSQHSYTVMFCANGKVEPIVSYLSGDNYFKSANTLTQGTTGTSAEHILLLPVRFKESFIAEMLGIAT